MFLKNVILPFYFASPVLSARVEGGEANLILGMRIGNRDNAHFCSRNL